VDGSLELEQPSTPGEIVARTWNTALMTNTPQTGRIAQLRTQVAAGAYRVGPDVVAEAMVRRPAVVGLAASVRAPARTLSRAA